MGLTGVNRRGIRTWMPIFAVAAVLVGCAGEPEVAEEPVAGGEAETAPATATETAPADSATDTAAGGALSGELVEFVVPYDPGGGYDTYARMLAPELADCLGGDVVVVNEPGAGSLLATNQTWTAPADGTRIQIFNTVGVLGSYIAEAPGVQYEAGDFSWIGRVTGEPSLVVTAPNGEFQSFQDMLGATADDPVTFVTTGPGSLELMDSTVLMEVFGIEGEVVSGFAGGGEGFQAVARGDADAQSRSLYSHLPNVENGDATPIILIGSEQVEALPDTPTILSVEVEDEVNQAVLEEHAALVESGRMIAGPPDMDADALQALRDCYEAAATDPELLAMAEEQGRPIQFLGGEQSDELVERVMGASPEYVEILRSAFAEG